MKRVGSFLGDWWRLVVPYFRSEERWIAISLLIGAIALTFAAVGLEVLFNDWNRRFYDSLQNKDEAAFWREIVIFSVLAFGFIAAGFTRTIVSHYLRLRLPRPRLPAPHRQPLPAPALAAVAAPPVSCPLARRARLLPHRTAAHR